MRALAREPSPAAREARVVQAPVSAPQPVAVRPPRTLARCGAGGCTCGGKCGGKGAQVDESELERLTLARSAIDAGGARALARAVAERHAVAAS